MRILRFTIVAAMLAACSTGGSSPTGGGSSVPTTVPSAPTGVTGSGGDARALIFFTTPTSTGGTFITFYTATCQAGTTDSHSATRAASPIAVGGLTNGVAYSCSVTATNAIGEGPASAAISVTPGATMAR